jgi:hypothetical protein
MYSDHAAALSGHTVHALQAYSSLAWCKCELLILEKCCSHMLTHTQARSECNFVNPCVEMPEAFCQDPDDLHNGTKLVCKCAKYGYSGDGLMAGLGCYKLNEQCRVPLDLPLAQHTYSAVHADGNYRNGRLDSGTGWLLNSAEVGPWAKLSLGKSLTPAVMLL